MAAQSLLRAAEAAAEQLGDLEVDQGLTAKEVLADPKTKASAVRWRAGGAPRQVTAALARLTSSLGRWVSGGPASSSQLASDQLEPVQPRPVRRPQSGETRETSSPDGFMWLVCRLRALRWRTVLAVMFVLLCPKLVALILALVVKLLVRAVVALLTHICKELFEQIMGAVGEIENNLVTWLSHHLGMETPTSAPLYLTTGQGVQQQPSQPSSPVPPSSLPTRPVDLVTVVLLVLNLRRGLPAGVGGGEPRG